MDPSNWSVKNLHHLFSRSRVKNSPVSFHTLLVYHGYYYEFLSSLLWNRDLSGFYFFPVFTLLENKHNGTGTPDSSVILSLPSCVFLMYSLELSNTTNREDLISPPHQGLRRNEKESMSCRNEFSPVLRIWF